MPSARFRVARLLARLTSILLFQAFYPVKYQRFFFSNVVPLFSIRAAGVKREHAAVPGIPAEWLIPDDAESGRALLYLHGGGYVIGSIRTYRNMVSHLASAAGCRALLIEYRLAPENRFPCAVEDAVTAYRWLLSQGYDPGNIAIAGDSAGGGLAAATLVSLRDAGEPLPAAAMLLSPWTDLEGTGESLGTVGWRDPMLNKWIIRKMAASYLGDADPRDPLASPLYADLSGLPPLLIQAGTSEILLDDARRLAERAEEAGVSVKLDIREGMFHVWQFFAPLVPESREALERIGRFYREKVGAKAG
ncbi:MAG: alpha/beta hydrolase [Actinobacteria bacterium]|nr:alpha/beta hydrolase [Actinomycetota bacterium]